jgi:hypothetical protein
MTAVLERVPVDRITAEAKDIQFWRTVLTVLAGLLYGLGWVTAKTFTVLWRAVVWVGVAVKVGWQDARKSEATVST